MSKTQSTKALYDVVYVKRDPATLEFVTKKSDEKDENGDAIILPIAGEKIKTLTMHEETVNEYNLHWDSTGKFMRLAKQQPKKEVAQSGGGDDTKQPTLKQEFAEVFAMKRDELEQNLSGFGLSVEGNVDVLKPRLAQFLKDNK
jgi:hypothetical protein